MEEMIQRKVETMIKSGDGSAGLLHKITKPTLWRGGAKRKEWAKHWQCDESVQNVEDKPSGLCKAITGVGCDGFHPNVPLDLTKETRKEIVEFLEKVEQSGKWQQQACTTMFLLIPEECCESEADCADAHVDTFVGGCESARSGKVAAEVSCGVGRNTDGGNGGAQRTVWEIVMEMERSDGRAKAEDQGC